MPKYEVSYLEPVNGEGVVTFVEVEADDVNAYNGLVCLHKRNDGDSGVLPRIYHELVAAVPLDRLISIEKVDE